MKHYQDTETGQVYGFEDDVNPFTLNNRNIPKSLIEEVKERPTPHELYVWYKNDWIHIDQAPSGYTKPISSVPSYNPAWITYLSPYTAIHKDSSSNLNITLDQINSNSYKGSDLARVVMSLPLNIPSGIPALISYDGAIAIPRCADIPTNSIALDILNDIQTSLFIGGIATEVTHLSNMACGSLEDQTMLFSSYQTMQSIHTELRLNAAGAINLIPPLMFPRVLMVKEIEECFNQGNQFKKAINEFASFFLLNGYTAMINQNFSDALNNLWISVEQLTNIIWNVIYLQNTYPKRIAAIQLKLKKELHNVGPKHKLLRLSKVITKNCYKSICAARLARNKLLHTGKSIDKFIVYNLWSVLPELLEIASGMSSLGIRKIGLTTYGELDTTGKTNFDEWINLSKNI